jgi:hypothetical protein
VLSLPGALLQPRWRKPAVVAFPSIKDVHGNAGSFYVPQKFAAQLRLLVCAFNQARQDFA